ncbi:HET domain-containing protein [Rutstroemia sp. NJR-2017a BBW]|nr:HET domain-containing protein [Rutstroemia sp. NJR-2017a BBW]
MRLLRLLSDGTLEITEWQAGEVTLQDLANPKSSTKPGYAKITACCLQAAKDGYEYTWIDTCCIDKTSSAELSESINSMFKWYQQAGICYAYLSDISIAPETHLTECESPAWVNGTPLSQPVAPMSGYWSGSISLPSCCPESSRPASPVGDGSNEGFEPFSAAPNLTSAIFESQYFSRGWTLQELIAPKEVVFYSGDWQKISTKKELIDGLSYTTGIDAAALRGEPLASFSVANRMSWASRRQTTREEDMAYCLLGLFDVNIPLLYGEGRVKAFIRLQEEIMKAINDPTLFASHPDGNHQSQYIGLLAESPTWFESSRTTEIYEDTSRQYPARLTNIGISIQLPIFEWGDTTIGWLGCQIETNKHRGSAGIFLAKVEGHENTYLRCSRPEKCPWLTVVENLHVHRHNEDKIKTREILILHKAPLWYKNNESLLELCIGLACDMFRSLLFLVGVSAIAMATKI